MMLMDGDALITRLGNFKHGDFVPFIRGVVKKLLPARSPAEIPVEFVKRCSFTEIEHHLNSKIVDIERVKKIRGSNANSFYISTGASGRADKRYFLKFGRDKSIDDELKGDRCIVGFLNTPEMICFSKRKIFGYEWVLYEHVEGELMSELFSAIDDEHKEHSLFSLEMKKESSLRKLHTKNVHRIDFNTYKRLRANKLFYRRFTGDLFKEFYCRDKQDNISALFDKTIFLNGHQIPLTIWEMVDSIHQRYRTNKHKSVKGIMGHGDAHHGNIIINEGVWFIDNEYAGISTPFMELAKPYYNDFLGNLFFGGIERSDRYLDACNFRETDREIHMGLNFKEEFDRLIELTKIKLSARRVDINRNTEDFLMLNDYLFMCHLLTKNPNEYATHSRYLFVACAALLMLFDPLNPDSFRSICDVGKYVPSE